MSIQLLTTPQSMRRAMRHIFTIITLCLGLFSSEQAFGQGVPMSTRGGTGHPATCLIVERVGTFDRVTSRMLALGTHGKQFQFVEGNLPEGFAFHDRFTDRDISDLEARGSDVVILNSDFMPDDLQQARDYCRAQTQKTAVQPRTAEIEIASNPSGSDIEIDGKFIGSTPSSVRLDLGEHTIKLSQNGYATWERKLTTVAGNVTISPELEPVVATQDSTGETPTSLLSTTAKPF